MITQNIVTLNQIVDKTMSCFECVNDELLNKQEVLISYVFSLMYEH